MPKILIVDDEPNMQLLLQQTLAEFEDAGVELITVDNGEAALHTIKQVQPELVFLDISLPRMNGIEVCKLIKNYHELKNVYIIMLTARCHEFDKKTGLAAGADLYLAKPFDPERLIEKTYEVLGLKRK